MCRVGAQQVPPLRNYAELAILFFLHGMAMAMWFVPLTSVLEAHGFGRIVSFAYAASAAAAFISPLIFGAMADHQLGPVRVLRFLALTTGAAIDRKSTR